MQPGVLGCSAAPLVSGAGRLMIFAGEGGRGLRGRFGRGEGGLWYGTTDFPHIFHVHPLIGIFVHKWKFCRKFGAERFTLLIVFNHATSEPSRTEVFIAIRNDNNDETFTWQQLRRALYQTRKQTNAKKTTITTMMLSLGYSCRQLCPTSVPDSPLLCLLLLLCTQSHSAAIWGFLDAIASLLEMIITHQRWV